MTQIRTLNKTIDQIEDTSRDILKRRRDKSDLEAGRGSSKDILGVLLEAQKSDSNAETLPEPEIIGQITFAMKFFEIKNPF